MLLFRKDRLQFSNNSKISRFCNNSQCSTNTYSLQCSSNNKCNHQFNNTITYQHHKPMGSN